MTCVPWHMPRCTVPRWPLIRHAVSLNAEGHFRSSAEDTLVIQVATDKPERVQQMAHKLRCFLNQEGVGVLCRGIYQRVRYWTDDRMLLQAWGFPAKQA